MSNESQSILSEKLFVGIEELCLPMRSYNSLQRAGISSVMEVLQLGEGGLREIHFLGDSQVDTITTAITNYLGISKEELPSFVIESMPVEITSLPLAVLGLSSRPSHVFEKLGIQTVGELLELRYWGLSQVAGLGKKSIAEVESVLIALLENPDIVSIALEEGVDNGYVPGEVASLPVSLLNLSSRSSNALKKSDIHTIEDLMKYKAIGFSRIKGIGYVSSAEIESSLSNFLHRVVNLTDEEIRRMNTSQLILSGDDIVNFLGVTVNHSDRRIDNAENKKNDSLKTDRLTLPNLVKIIVPFAERVLQKLNRERDFEVLKLRFGLLQGKSYTLQDIGYYYGITRERVRQIEKRSLEIIEGYLFGRRVASDWRVPQELIEESLQLYQYLRAGDPILTQSETIMMVESRYHIAFPSSEISSLEFLMNVFGFHNFPSNKTRLAPIRYHSAWIVDENLNQRVLYTTIKAVHKLLMDAIVPLSLLELTAAVNRRRKKRIPTEYVHLALKLLFEVEKTQQDYYQIKLEWLSSLSDKAYRLLYHNGDPLDINTLLRLINQNSVKAKLPLAKKRSLVGQLVADSRFAPIGKSGRWTLSEWDHVSRKTIVQIMEDFFHLEQKSCTVAELFLYVQSKRPKVSKHSIASYLSQRNDIFVKVGANKYALTAWGGSSQRSARHPLSSNEVRERLLDAIPDVFASSGTDTLLLAELVHELELRTKLSSATLYSSLRRLDFVQIKNHPQYTRRKVVTFEGRGRVSKSLSRRTIREAVRTEVLHFLRNQPNRKALVADVATHVVNTVQCPKQTFYQYLSSIPSIKKEKLNGKLYCYIISDTDNPTPVSVNFEGIDDEFLRQNIRKAVAHLNIDDVDIGLFQLGKILEREIKTFLLEAQKASIFQVKGRDLRSFSSMIDCIERNEIIKSKHHLTLLRQERNERAHGDIPDLKERERLFRQAPFLAGLFIDYISFFFEKRQEILLTGDS